MQTSSITSAELRDLIEQHLGFLVGEHGYVINKIDDWTYHIENQTTRVIVRLEQGIAFSIGIEAIGEGARQLLRENILPHGGMSLLTICMCLDPDLEYSEEYIESVRIPAKLPIEIKIPNVPVEIEKRAALLKKYCGKIINGDFSEWPMIEKCRKERGREIYNKLMERSFE